jgi:hypothetical protein
LMETGRITVGHSGLLLHERVCRVVLKHQAGIVFVIFVTLARIVYLSR